MAPSGTSASTEDKIKDLLEDLDLQKLIYEDLLERRPGGSEESAEVLETIQNLESQVAQLLGEAAPSAPTNVPSPAPAPPTPTPPTPTPAPAREPPGLTPNHPQQLSTSVPYWPSSAPSPFAAQPDRPDPMSYPALPSESSRKRPRQDSGGSRPHHGSSKKSTFVTSQSRFSAIEAELEARLAENRVLYDDMRDPELVRISAQAEGVPASKILDDIQREQDDNEWLIQSEFQVERDAEVARMLQAQEDEVETAPRDIMPHPSFALPDRTQPSNGSGPSDSYKSSRFLPPPPGLFISSPSDAFQRDSDDDIQEIPASYFNSRINGSPAPRRPLPWLPGAWPGPNLPGIPRPGVPGPAPELKVFDLVREQQMLDADENDLVLYEEKDFPDDIKNLLTGIKNIRDATQTDNQDTPRELKVTLMKHQKIGLTWLKAKEESSHKGGILADDMGLGKTIQAIALMVARPYTDPERRPSLIIAPKALMDQWRLEIHRHIKPGRHQLSVFVFHEKQRRVTWRELRNYDVVLTTFGTLTVSYKLLLQAEKFEEEGRDASLVRSFQEKSTLFTSSSKWHRVIVDEAQNIKNPMAKATKACCRLNATYRWCLTGTPMMNRLEDFQSLLGFLRIRPYNIKDKFKRDFLRPIKSGFGEEKTMEQLRILVKSVCLRRTKASKIDGQPILQLPPKVTEKIHVVFNETENEMYQALSSKTQQQVTRYLNAGTLGRNYSHVLVLLLRLRQACCHPLLMPGFKADAPTSVDGVDLVANAKLLSSAVVDRIKNNTHECPICLDSVENAIIYIPCGHSVCSECFTSISEPTTAAIGPDGERVIKCQNCRGPVDPLKITDAHSFKKIHDTDSLPPTEDAEEEEDEPEETTDSDDSEPDSDDSSGQPKRKSLSALRQAAQKNKRQKRRYLRRLEKAWVPSAKIDKAMEILQDNEDRGQDEKTIVFSQFTSLLDLLEVPIIRRGWKCARFDGTMNVSERNAAVTNFTHDPGCKIMLVSLKAGNAGLNLVAASHIIMFDPFWNPYIEDQAVDRAHRIGQVRDVFVHRLLIENTVEDRIVTLQEKKRELIGGALDEGGAMNVSRLDTRELAYLFGVRA